MTEKLMTVKQGFMVDRVQVNGDPAQVSSPSPMPWSELSPAERRRAIATNGLPFEMPMPSEIDVRLNLQDLNCFEVVERQFEKWGAVFRNALALSPSNPAFPTHSGSIVLMGGPKSGSMEVIFTQPISRVRALVTSSRRTVLSAYDRDGQLLAKTETSAPNLAGSQSNLSPNTLLSLDSENIHRIGFYSFDGQLTVADFAFGF
jgi:hypothetical protein